MFTMVKTMSGYPCAHRQWRDTGHCRWIHGYSRTFTFTFASDALDQHGWVLGFGQLKPLKAYLDKMFDHTLLINNDDPLLPALLVLDGDAYTIRTLPNVGMEGTAKHLHGWVNDWLYHTLDEADMARKVRCVAVESRENEKNAAIYTMDKGIAAPL
jgi:6-pyruvoyltetrahydropterin/6-carboxytetrahydropterin synthase